MKIPQHLEKRIMRGLRIMADTEKAGRFMPAKELGAELGMSESAGLEARSLLVQLGLLREERPEGRGKLVTRVSLTGWAALQEDPPVAPERKVRNCLMCRRPFEPDGPMFVCLPCKGTKAWRASACPY